MKRAFLLLSIVLLILSCSQSKTDSSNTNLDSANEKRGATSEDDEAISVENEKLKEEKKKSIDEFNRKSRALVKLRGMGIRLRGEYTADELEDMVKGYGQTSSSTKEKMLARGDGDIVSQFY